MRFSVRVTRTIIDKMSPDRTLALLLLSVVGLSCTGEEPAFRATPLDDFSAPFYFGEFRVPRDNPLTQEGVALGRALFYETQLSADGTVSCSFCHRQEKAFTDGKPLAVGLSGVPLRRSTMSLANLMWGPRKFFWDGRAESLAHQALQPIQDPDEMGETLEGVLEKLASMQLYPERFNAAFGTPEITPERIAKALASFERTLVSSNSKYDQYLRGEVELSEQEMFGRRLFSTHPDAKIGIRGANCGDCHSQFLTGGFDTALDGFTNNGLDTEEELEEGLAAVTGFPHDRGKFKVPTLRNVALTAPYMHDGRFETLDEVLDHYNAHIMESSTLDPLLREASNALREPADPPALLLTEEEKEAVVAFLHTLTDYEFVNNAKFSNPHR